MKKVILFAFIFTLGIAHAQEFQTTDKYRLTNEHSFGQEEEGAVQMDLVASEEVSQIIATLQITEAALLESMQVSVLTDTDLEGVVEIIKVDFEYTACCSSADTYYFLVTYDGDTIALPRIQNLFCEDFTRYSDYVFPSQLHGQKGTILLAETDLTATHATKDITIVQSFFWNDDDFEQEEAVTVN